MSEQIISYLPNGFESRIEKELGLKLMLTKTSGSTNEDLKTLARAGAVNGSVLIAETQSRGHGQYQRVFESPEGGIYLSVLFRTGMPTEETMQLTSVIGLKMQEAVYNVCGVKADIKAPNDLLVNGKKICGILVESYTEPASLAIVIGTGINVNTDCSRFSRELRENASSLAEITGSPVDMARLTEEILRQIVSIPLLNKTLNSL